MAISVLGDFITAVQGRSKTGVVYSVAPSTVNPGWTDVLRNGTRTSSFLWAGVGRGDMVCGYTDANPNGLLVEILSPDGVSSKADVAQFINSLN
jgi:hypothetical protein